MEILFYGNKIRLVKKGIYCVNCFAFMLLEGSTSKLKAIQGMLFICEMRYLRNCFHCVG